jgi:hypothetical protein
LGAGVGRSKKAAEQQAAEAAWIKISAGIADDSPASDSPASDSPASDSPASDSPASGSPPAEAGNAPDAPGEGGQGYDPEL